jgi:hypothetical protein
MSVSMGVFETISSCVESRSVERCCSKRLVYISVFLAHLIDAGKKRLWLTTSELCTRVGLDKKSCNPARRYLYELKEMGVVESKRSLRNEAMWRVKPEALGGLDPDKAIKVLVEHYKLCMGVLK